MEPAASEGLQAADAPLQRTRSLKRNESIEKAKAFGEAFKVYLFIECGIWLPFCWVACYRFQPTVRLMQTRGGRRFVERSGDFLERNAPSWHASIMRLAGKIQGAPRVRATGEWALINKVLAPIGFPTKLWIAHKFVQRRDGAAAAAEPTIADSTKAPGNPFR